MPSRRHRCLDTPLGRSTLFRVDRCGSHVWLSWACTCLSILRHPFLMYVSIRWLLSGCGNLHIHIRVHTLHFNVQVVVPRKFLCQIFMFYHFVKVFSLKKCMLDSLSTCWLLNHCAQNTLNGKRDAFAYCIAENFAGAEFRGTACQPFRRKFRGFIFRVFSTWGPHPHVMDIFTCRDRHAPVRTQCMQPCIDDAMQSTVLKQEKKKSHPQKQLWYRMLLM